MSMQVEDGEKQNFVSSTVLSNWQWNLEMLDARAVDSRMFLSWLLHTYVPEGVSVIWSCSSALVSSSLLQNGR